MNFRKVLLLPVVAVSLLAASCSGVMPADSELRLVSFSPNQCAEPWDAEAYNTISDRGQRMANYLKAQGISGVYEIKSRPDDSGLMTCQACTCPSLQIYSFKIRQAEYAKLRTIPPFDTYVK